MTTQANPLLPYSSTKFEHRVSLALSACADLPVAIASLADIDTAPDDFLSFLAYQYSVDSWDNAWQADIQRSLIKQSFAVHQIKGTTAAIRQILDKFGYEMQLTEWWQHNPPLAAGSFSLSLSTGLKTMDEATYRELNRLINDAKPVSRHLANLSVSLSPQANAHLAAAVHIGDDITIYPKEPA